MIQADIFYTVKCDRCHRTLGEAHDGLEITHFPNEREAKEFAIAMIGLSKMVNTIAQIAL